MYNFRPESSCAVCSLVIPIIDNATDRTIWGWPRLRRYASYWLLKSSDTTTFQSPERSISGCETAHRSPLGRTNGANSASTSLLSFSATTSLTFSGNTSFSITWVTCETTFWKTAIGSFSILGAFSLTYAKKGSSFPENKGVIDVLPASFSSTARLSAAVRDASSSSSTKTASSFSVLAPGRASSLFASKSATDSSVNVSPLVSSSITVVSFNNVSPLVGSSNAAVTTSVATVAFIGKSSVGGVIFLIFLTSVVSSSFLVSSVLVNKDFSHNRGFTKKNLKTDVIAFKTPDAALRNGDNFCPSPSASLVSVPNSRIVPPSFLDDFNNARDAKARDAIAFLEDGR
mmetsp:Transcript_44850/g.67504  ORF Transcript_44850/g.67504 Transcript_44850/m.67504 type:complete len:344 (+) Transcript_44850:419-1450(+)